MIANAIDSPVVRSLLALAVSSGGTLLLGLLLIPRLRRLEWLEKVRKTDSPELARRHGSKEGTPTLGGLLFLPPLVGATLLFARPTPPVWIAVAVVTALGLLGLRDDWIKLRSPRRHGLRKRGKLLVQGLVSAAAGLALILARGEGDAATVAVPFVGASLDLSALGGVLYVLLAVAVITASSNSVNLADGLDGLAAGCTLLAIAPFAVLGLVAGHPDAMRVLSVPFAPGAGEMAVFAAATAGACLGFLWFNCHPARVFMGDTGALALGGALGVTALALRLELLLLLVGGVFVLESVSVMLQVFSFRVFGRRIFRIAPIHHHYQFGGVPEVLVTRRFWLAGAVLGAAPVVAIVLGA